MARFPAGVPVQRLVYTIWVANVSGFTLTDVVLTDAIPTGTTFAWASADHAYEGGMVTWTVPSVQPWAMLTATVGVTVAHLPPGTVVVNASYGVNAAELLAPVVGLPVVAVVPGRVALPVVLSGWSP